MVTHFRLDLHKELEASFYFLSSSVTDFNMTQGLITAFNEEIARCFTFEECLKNIGDQSKSKDESQTFDSGQYLGSFLTHYTFPSIHWLDTCLYGFVMQALDIKEQKHSVDHYNLDIPEDEDISYAFDHHSLVTSQLPDSYDDIVQTADEVIKEIDILMVKNVGSSWLREEALQNLSPNELNAVLEELESCVREYSAILVQELAYREELDFEQEQKDIFIARLNELHRRLERRRRLSMPPGSHIQMLSNSIAMEDYGEKYRTIEKSTGSERMVLSPSTVQKETTQFILRAHGTEEAFQRLSTFSRDNSATTVYQTDACNPICTPSRLSANNHNGKISSDKDEQTSARAIAISRLRKWAGRKSEEPSESGRTSSFRAFLRRGRQQAETTTNAFIRSREARSAVTSPTSSHCDFPSIPTNLTHSASGHLIGRPEISSDDLEYKYLTTSVPYHRSPYKEGPTVSQLELFNDMLLAILTNNPNLTPMLTDYILNVYAPADRRLSKLPI
ncbi:unnamed protein product [Heterobilharzia americana]|nr:unnamed protein product [Heterobilharzia americana]